MTDISIPPILDSLLYRDSAIPEFTFRANIRRGKSNELINLFIGRSYILTKKDAKWRARPPRWPGDNVRAWLTAIQTTDSEVRLGHTPGGQRSFGYDTAFSGFNVRQWQGRGSVQGRIYWREAVEGRERSAKKPDIHDSLSPTTEPDLPPIRGHVTVDLPAGFILALIVTLNNNLSIAI
ncbi:hypothetical protein J6590_040731 [Homalodisca vitripennis]|nr:hypothetical protein J6590_040731 [Homalodisca vitripennis]